MLSFKACKYSRAQQQFHQHISFITLSFEYSQLLLYMLNFITQKLLIKYDEIDSWRGLKKNGRSVVVVVVVGKGVRE